MIRFRIVDEFIADLREVRSVEELRCALVKVKIAMGFNYMALTHHADISEGRAKIIRVHDYPEDWVQEFDRRELGRIDPVHRATHMTSKGFFWSQLQRLIQMHASDWAVLNNARAHNIGDGFTIPVHVPGESNGSVSFAMAVGKRLPEEMLVIIPKIAQEAFECARQLWRMRPPPDVKPILTPTQRVYAYWAMHGKTDWETSQIVGCQPCTVVRQLKLARERYGVDNKTLLLFRALLDGTLSLADLYVF